MKAYFVLLLFVLVGSSCVQPDGIQEWVSSKKAEEEAELVEIAAPPNARGDFCYVEHLESLSDDEWATLPDIAVIGTISGIEPVYDAALVSGHNDAGLADDDGKCDRWVRVSLRLSLADTLVLGSRLKSVPEDISVFVYARTMGPWQGHPMIQASVESEVQWSNSNAVDFGRFDIGQTYMFRLFDHPQDGLHLAGLTPHFLREDGFLEAIGPDIGNYYGPPEEDKSFEVVGQATMENLFRKNQDKPRTSRALSWLDEVSYTKRDPLPHSSCQY